VLAPAIVAASMVVAGSTVLIWEARGRAFWVSRWDWLTIVTGGLILIAAFCWNCRNIAAGGMPNPFPWPLFVAGEAIGFSGFLRANWTNRAAASARWKTAASLGDSIMTSAEAERT
jgi:hypothetical protein